MVDLGALPGGTRSSNTAINNAGQIVGTSYNAASQPHAVIWSGPWKDLVVNFGPGTGLWALRRTAWQG